jgi:multiple sugar transport system substrate-binding protein
MRWHCSKALLADNDTRGAFRQALFRRALGFYAGVFREGLAPAMSAAQISNVWDESRARPVRVLRQRALNIGEFRRRLPRERQADGRRRRCRVLTGRASTPVARARDLQALAAQGCGVAPGRALLSEPATMQRHALTATCRRAAALAHSRARELRCAAQAFARQLERVRAAPKIPEWERIFQAMQLTAERGSHAPRHRRKRRRSSTRGSTPCSRSAASTARARAQRATPR